MSIPSDLYKVLQVDPEAESEVIRAAYRTLAVKYHPDVAPDSQERMAALNHAWGILRDATARARYDEARAETRRHPRLSRPVVTTTMPAPVPASPPGEPSGEVLAFGRYSGWSLGQIAKFDPEYLDWLASAPIGHAYRREIHALRAPRAGVAGAAAATATPPASGLRPGRFGRA